MSILKIAEGEGVDPGTVSAWLHRLGVEIRAGQHFVLQPPIRLPDQLASLVAQGKDRVIRYLDDHVWGLQVSNVGLEQLEKFCKFLALYNAQCGVKEIASEVGAHRSTILKWRNGTDMPYLIRALKDALQVSPVAGWRALPLRVESGGNEPSHWVVVPAQIGNYGDITALVGQLRMLPEAYERASRFGIGPVRLEEMKEELLAYELGVMLGDASKLGGKQERFASANLDLQLSVKHVSNERMGEFVCMAANALGIKADRIANKKPSGASLFGRQPAEAYRWATARSPLFAWMFRVCLGLEFGQNTTSSPVHMDWIRATPREFRIRFVQGVADSDGTVKASEILVVSVPNAEFITLVLKELGMKTAHTVYENGLPLRTMVNRRESNALPIFNEFVRSYRYEKAFGLDSRQ